MAEPQPDKMHVALDGNCNETVATSRETQSADIYFPFWARGIPDCLGISPTSY